MKPALFVGPWQLSAIDQIEKNGLKVFSCFHCGGGSTMGYKLAGFDVLGGVEIDQEMMAIYRANHHPRHSFHMGVQDFKALPSIPAELYELDILDGSPPCSAFSTAGSRDKKWGVETYFREGQEKQRLDDLFFHFIDIAAKLQPKVVVAENVKGLIIGKAKGYVAEIFREFNKAGYRCQLFLLNASRMGVPQSRERTFFIAVRNDIAGDPIKLNFTEQPISVIEAIADIKTGQMGRRDPLPASVLPLWQRTKPGDACSSVHPKGSFFNKTKVDPNRPAATMTAERSLCHWSEPRYMNEKECLRIQSFPDDYQKADNSVDLRYVCGMSVPPFMMQRVALEIGRQVFGIDYDHTRRTLA